MRALPFLEGSFTHALSLFTSFGYFYTEEEHLLVLSEVSRILVPGGILLLDFMNASLTIKHLKAKTTRTLGPLTVTETRSYDEGSKRINKWIEIKETPTGALSQEPETRSFFESVRAFSKEELAALLQRAGFSIESLAGDFEGAPYSDSSSRLIVTARSSRRPSDKKSST
jgi:ubiquinone/menaquinone biosynthesis C-methylase UbiE